MAAATAAARAGPTDKKNPKPQPMGCLTELGHYNRRTGKTSNLT